MSEVCSAGHRLGFRQAADTPPRKQPGNAPGHVGEEDGCRKGGKQVETRRRPGVARAPSFSLLVHRPARMPALPKNSDSSFGLVRALWEGGHAGRRRARNENDGALRVLTRRSRSHSWRADRHRGTAASCRPFQAHFSIARTLLGARRNGGTRAGMLDRGRTSSDSSIPSVSAMKVRRAWHRA